VLADGRMWCWGGNDQGQLGIAFTFPVGAEAPPTRVTGLVDAVEVRCGGRHTCARLASGGVRCWGNGDQGQLGSGPEGSGHRSARPVRVRGLP